MAKKNTIEKYVVTDGHIIWHSMEDRYYYAGELIDLSHLDEKNINVLMASGLIAVQTKEIKENDSD